MTVVDKSSDITITLAPDIKQPNRIIAEHSGSAAGLFTANSQSNGELYYHWSSHQPNAILFNVDGYGGQLDTEQDYTTNSEQFFATPGTDLHKLKASSNVISNYLPGLPIDGRIRLEKNGGWPRNYTGTSWYNAFPASVAKLQIQDTQNNANHEVYPRAGIGSNPYEFGTEAVSVSGNQLSLLRLGGGPVEEQAYDNVSVSSLGTWEDQNAVVFYNKFVSEPADFAYYGFRRTHNGNFSDHIAEGGTMYCCVVGIDGDFSSGTTTNVFVKYASWTWQIDDKNSGGEGGRGDLSVLPVQSRPVAMRGSRPNETFKPKLRGRPR